MWYKLSVRNSDFYSETMSVCVVVVVVVVVVVMRAMGDSHQKLRRSIVVATRPLQTYKIIATFIGTLTSLHNLQLSVLQKSETRITEPYVEIILYKRRSSRSIREFKQPTTTAKSASSKNIST